MNVREKRIHNDLKNLEEFIKKYDFLSIKKIEGKPIQSIKLKLNQSLPINKTKWKDEFEINIDFPSNYPISAPIFFIKPRVFHPHVFANGNICMGIWKMTNSLQLEVERLLKILFFYEDYLNFSSPAEVEALSWYKMNKKMFPVRII